MIIIIINNHYNHQALVDVSTAYCNCDIPHIEERYLSRHRPNNKNLWRSLLEVFGVSNFSNIECTRPLVTPTAWLRCAPGWTRACSTPLRSPRRWSATGPTPTPSPRSVGDLSFKDKFLSKALAESLLESEALELPVSSWFHDFFLISNNET